MKKGHYKNRLDELKGNWTKEFWADVKNEN